MERLVLKARVEQVESNQAEPSQVEPSQAEPDQIEPGQVEPDHVPLDQVRPGQNESNQVEPNQVVRFVARVEGIDVQAEGDSPDVAREELIQAMITWISARDSSDSMALALAEAGFPEVDDETELHLEFEEPLAGWPGSALRDDD